jgi:hypothetical protein
VLPLTGKRKPEGDAYFLGKVTHFMLFVLRETGPKAGTGT